MTLKEYRRKRGFEKSPEPEGAAPERPARPESAPETAPEAGARRAAFVVHKHKASRLHYDLRLEIGGVLKSWAIPKGPSMDPADKRLAVLVEDHPYEYKDFEGIIPEGEYGAGAVIIWDEGTWEAGEGGAARALAAGAVKVRFDGHKLKGGFRLVQTKMGGKEENWLLIKERDVFADSEGDILEDEPRSVRSGLTVEELEERG